MPNVVRGKTVQVIAVLLALSVSCGPTEQYLGIDQHPDHIDLPAWYSPLRRVQKDDSTPVGFYHTVGDLVLTGDCGDFLLRDANQQRALLRHEQYHAVREQQFGLAWYLATYATDS